MGRQWVNKFTYTVMFSLLPAGVQHTPVPGGPFTVKYSGAPHFLFHSLRHKTNAMFRHIQGPYVSFKVFRCLKASLFHICWIIWGSGGTVANYCSSSAHSGESKGSIWVLFYSYLYAPAWGSFSERLVLELLRLFHQFSLSYNCFNMHGDLQVGWFWLFRSQR